MRERPEDPWLGWSGLHPELPAGFNSWAVNGDELNGPGVNEPIWPPLTDFYEAKRPVLYDQADLDRFAEECANVTIRCQNDTIMIRREIVDVMMRRSA